MPDKSEAFLAGLHNEKLGHQAHRSRLILVKLVLLSVFLGLGSTLPLVALPPYSLLALVPFVALVFDLHILVNNYKVGRIGLFLADAQECASFRERDWESWVSQHREPLGAYAPITVTTVTFAISAWLLYVRVYQELPAYVLRFFVLWAVSGLAATSGVLYYAWLLEVKLEIARLYRRAGRPDLEGDRTSETSSEVDRNDS